MTDIFHISSYLKQRTFIQSMHCLTTSMNDHEEAFFECCPFTLRKLHSACKYNSNFSFSFRRPCSSHGCSRQHEGLSHQAVLTSVQEHTFILAEEKPDWYIEQFVIGFYVRLVIGAHSKLVRSQTIACVHAKLWLAGWQSKHKYALPVFGGEVKATSWSCQVV